MQHRQGHNETTHLTVCLIKYAQQYAIETQTEQYTPSTEA